MALDPEVYRANTSTPTATADRSSCWPWTCCTTWPWCASNRKGSGFFEVPDRPVELAQGQYLYSLGNPLDLGFAISEGAYNGVVGAASTTS
jgi:serine protease Do